MKIQIGSTFNLGKDPSMALAIPGAGILRVIERSETYPFDHVELKKYHLVNLKKEIEKELIELREKEMENERQADIERL